MVKGKHNDSRIGYVPPLFESLQVSDSTKAWSIQTGMYGLMSFGLTIINIACIIIIGYLTLRVKQVTPSIVPPSFPNFWKNHVPAHNEQQRKMTEKSVTAKELLHVEASKALGLDATSPDHVGLADTFIQDAFEQALEDIKEEGILDRIPLTPNPLGSQRRLNVSFFSQVRNACKTSLLDKIINPINYALFFGSL